MFRQLVSLIALCVSMASAHTVMSYPGQRGNNLITNETFPYGMQWMYPCGGMGTSRNRTLWPINGGAIALQPGWFQGHATAFFYINMGFNTGDPSIDIDDGPANMSFPMLPVFQITGPSKNPYPGTFCLPQVPLPANTSVKVGDNATIQIIETAVHGAALFTCADITFADPADVPEVNATNCYNSSDIGFNNVFTVATGAASSLLHSTSISLSSAVMLFTTLLLLA